MRRSPPGVIFPRVRTYTLPRDDLFGVVYVKTDLEKRAVMLAEYLVEQRATVRQAAARFGVSKSTVHKDISERLERLDRGLWLRVKDILEQNKAERHIRGGEATRNKYMASARRARH